MDGFWASISIFNAVLLRVLLLLEKGLIDGRILGLNYSFQYCTTSSTTVT